MENTDKLLEALEQAALTGEGRERQILIKRALPLARQLVEDYKANEQNCAMSHVDESIYDALREENERLRREREEKPWASARMTIRDLQSRLSAAEAQRDSWKKHAEAVEGNLRVLGEHDIKPLKEKLKRAEEVVEAVHEHRPTGCPTTTRSPLPSAGTRRSDENLFDTP